MSMERVQCLAAEVVSRVLAGRSLDAELAATWHSESALMAQERGAVQDLSYGVLRHLGFLEAILGQLLHRPPLHHTFWPLIMNRSPSLSARVASEPRSLPAPGSENN